MGRHSDPEKSGPIKNILHKRDLKKMFKEAGLGPTDVYRMVWMPDTHYPDQDKQAVAAFRKFIVDYKPHGFGHIGDFLECGTVSHWDPARNSILEFVEQLDEGAAILADLAQASKARHRIFLVGNHEFWLDQFLEEKVPGIQAAMRGKGFSALESSSLFRELGFDVYPHNELLQIGHALFTHGIYTNKYHANKMLEVSGANIFYGHTEDQQKHSAVSIHGMHQAQSIGTLRDESKVRFIRKRPTNWITGFLIIEFRIDGTFTPYTPTIANGAFSYNGKLYDGKEKASGKGKRKGSKVKGKK